VTGDTQVSSYDLDEVRIALGGPDGGHVADEPKEEARDPKAQTDAECSRERAVDDGDGARSHRPSGSVRSARDARV